MKKPGIKNLQETERSSKGLRNTLFEEIDLLRRGESNPARARSISSLASQILQSAKLEIEMHRYVSGADQKSINTPAEIPQITL